MIVQSRAKAAMAGLLAAACLIVSCTAQKEEPLMQEQTETEAFAEVRENAREVAQLLGIDAGDHETGLAASPCRGPEGESADDGRFYVQGNYQLPYSGDHEQALTRLRERWEREGWKVKDFRMFNPGEGTVSVERPQDGLQISVESGRPPSAFALLILTPCYVPRAR